MKRELSKIQIEYIEGLKEAFGFYRVVLVGVDESFSLNHRITSNVDALQAITILRVEAMRAENEYMNPPLSGLSAVKQ